MEKIVVRSLCELDALVAEKLFGWFDLKPPAREGLLWIGSRSDVSEDDLISGWSVPAFSANFDQAWRIVDRLRTQHRRYVAIRTAPIGDASQLPIRVSVEWWDTQNPTVLPFPIHQETEAATAPIAICLAALKTIGIEVELQIE